MNEPSQLQAILIAKTVLELQNGDKVAESFAGYLHDSMVALRFCALFEQQDSHDLMLWLTDKLTTSMAQLQRSR